jgi:hypothetical protein
MSKKLSDDEQKLVQTVLTLAVENLAFRKGLLEDPAATIDRFSQALGFDSHKLSLESLDLIASITPEELRMMARLTEKAENHDVHGIKFVL